MQRLPFLVLELLVGESLDTRLERSGGRLDVEEALRLIDQLLSTLVAAHDKGIIHRDIKPENLFLTREGQLKLLDFGIARARDASGASATRTGSTMGTPAFMPPEQALGRTREIGPASDLWAVGATLFTLISGRVVHDGETANEILVAAATRQAPSLGAVAPWVAPDVVAVVDQALAFQAAQRWPSAVAMQHALRVAYRGLSWSPSSSAPPFQEGLTVVASPLLLTGTAVSHGPSALDSATPPGGSLPRAGTATTVSGSASVQALLPSSSPLRLQGWPLWGGVVLGVGGLALGLALRSSWTTPPGTTNAVVPATSSAISATDNPRPPVGPAPPQTSASSSAPPPPLGGSARVTVKGGTCELLVDGNVVGRGGDFRLELTAGEHRLVCRNGEAAQERMIRLSSGGQEEVVFRFVATGKDPRDRRR